MIRMCNECLSVNAHHPHCPEAEDAPEPTFTLWLAGRPMDDWLSSEGEMRTAAKAWGFSPSVVIEDGEADIVNEHGVVIGGCYVNESEVCDYE